MEGRSSGFYVMAFNSTNHSIQTEKKAALLFRIAVIPTPRELTNDCGLAIKFLDGDISAIKEFHKALAIPADLYFMSEEKNDGRRKAEKLT